MKFRTITLSVLAAISTAAFAEPQPATQATPEAPGFAPPRLLDMVPQVNPAAPPAAKTGGFGLPVIAPEPKPVPAAAPAEKRKPSKAEKSDSVSEEEAGTPDTGKKGKGSSARKKVKTESSGSGAIEASIAATVPNLQLNSDSVISLEADGSVSIPVAISALNRLVTPFENVVVNTVDDVQIKKLGGVVMVSAVEPASLIISDKDAPESAVMVNIVPQQGIAPRNIKILVTGKGGRTQATQSFGAGNTQNGLQKDAASAAATYMKGLLRDLAKGAIPTGFSLTKGSGSAADCYLPGLETKESQVISGAAFTIRIYASRNLAEQVTEVDERGCSAPHQRAAAVWPRVVLQPGERTEIFVIESLQPTGNSTLNSTRPSSI